MRIKYFFITSIVTLIGCMASTGYAYTDLSESASLSRALTVEYDGIEAWGDQYVLLQKEESGFSDYTMTYGVYDWEHDEWVMDYKDISGSDKADFRYAGEGMFLFDLYGEDDISGWIDLLDPFTGEVCSIPADEDELRFPLDNNMGFVGGYMVAHSDYYAADYNNQDLYIFDAEGDFIDTELEMEYECCGEGKILFRNEECFVVFLPGEYGDAIAVMDYEANLLLVVDDPDYMSAFVNNSNDIESKASVAGEYLFLTDMTGMDGENYSAVFDFEGNLVVAATKCDRGFMTENGNLLLVNGENAEEIEILNANADDVKKITDLPAIYSYELYEDGVEEQALMADKTDTLHKNILIYPEIIFGGEHDPYTLEQRFYLGGRYTRLRGYAFIPAQQSVVVNNSLWIVGDNDQLLYQSEPITSETYGFEFDVDVSNVYELSLGYKGIMDKVVLSDVCVYTDTDTIDEQNDSSSIDNEDQSHDTRLTFMNSYIGELNNYGPQTDNMGNTYSDCFIAFGNSTKATYDIGGEYDLFTATVAVTKAEVNEVLFTDNYAGLRIMGDGNVLYEDLLLGIDTKPFELNLDISGVTDLTIEMYGKDTNLNYYQGLYLILADAILHHN